MNGRQRAAKSLLFPESALGQLRGARPKQNLRHKVLRPPIVDGALQIHRGSDSPIGTQSSWPPLFGYRKNAKKKSGYWYSTGLCSFDQTFQKLRPLSATIQENVNFTCHFGGFFFLGLPLFCLFFVIFPPNKSYARIFRGFP